MESRFDAFIKAKQERRSGKNKTPAQALKEFISYRNREEPVVDKSKPQRKTAHKKAQPIVVLDNQPEWSFLDD